MKGKNGTLNMLRRGWAAVLCVGVLWYLGGEELLALGGNFLTGGGLTELVLTTQLGDGDWLKGQEKGSVGTDPALLTLSQASPALGAAQIETDTQGENYPVAEETAPPSSYVTTALYTETVETTETAEPVTVELEAISVKNQSGLAVDLAEVAAMDWTLNLSGAPQILIVHTHGSEAYTPEGEDVYEESDSYRTTDSSCNVVRVGEELAESLRAQGFSVLHDTSLYDYPSYTGSYSRALSGISKWLEEYPTITMVLDIHRDALISDTGTASKVLTTLNGEKTAQVMLVVGTDGGGLWHPDWRRNLSLAMTVQQSMLDLEPTLCRAIDLRSSRFNQHLTSGSLLVEIGSCGNTLQEALRGARAFGEALGRVLLSNSE